MTGAKINGIGSYNPNTDIIVGNKVFKNVQLQKEDNSIDWDKSKRRITYLRGKDADYVTWQRNDDLYLYEKAYHKSKTKVLGGKEYDNIVARRIGKDGLKVYEQRLADGGKNLIKVSNAGDILDFKSCPKIVKKEGFFKKLFGFLF